MSVVNDISISLDYCRINFSLSLKFLDVFNCLFLIHLFQFICLIVSANYFVRHTEGENFVYFFTEGENSLTERTGIKLV
jgi:hypothetical protein